MNLYVVNNKYWFELENLTRLFFPNEKINVHKNDENITAPFILAALSDKITVRVHIGDWQQEKTAPLAEKDNENELQTVQLLYQLLRDYTGVAQPWGLLTGVRPIKLFRHLTEEHGAAYAEQRFLDSYYVSPEKVSLAAMTERNERRILDYSRPESFSLYVGIPFCPSRCSYCSFVMAPPSSCRRISCQASIAG